MIITPIKTHKIHSEEQSIFALLDQYLPFFSDGSVLAVTSKIVALCEGRVASPSADKDELIKKEANWYLPRELNKYHVMLTIKNSMMAAAAGIDESNVEEGYVLWPEDPQKSANEMREYLVKRFGVKRCGVILTDSKTTPLRWGVTGMGISYSGFEVLNNYIGKKDIFGREMKLTKVNVMDSLAASAVYVMGEGKEQTPLAVLSDIPHLIYQDRNPTTEELEALYIDMDDDLYGRILSLAPWKKGEGK